MLDALTQKPTQKEPYDVLYQRVCFVAGLGRSCAWRTSWSGPGSKGSSLHNSRTSCSCSLQPYCSLAAACNRQRQLLLAPQMLASLAWDVPVPLQQFRPWWETTVASQSAMPPSLEVLRLVALPQMASLASSPTLDPATTWAPQQASQAQVSGASRQSNVSQALSADLARFQTISPECQTFKTMSSDCQTAQAATTACLLRQRLPCMAYAGDLGYIGYVSAVCRNSCLTQLACMWLNDHLMPGVIRLCLVTLNFKRSDASNPYALSLSN